MAKKYISRRRYRKVVKWAPNIFEIPTTSVQTTYNSTFYYEYTLARNPAQENVSVSQTFTVKNISIDFYCDLTSTSNFPARIEDITVYIMYKPQGMTVTEEYNKQHPEYILNYKYIGSPSDDNEYIPGDGGQYIKNKGQNYQPHRLRSRLSRKLQTGDSIILFVKGNNVGTSSSYSIPFNIHGLIRWWTKAN